MQEQLFQVVKMVHLEMRELTLEAGVPTAKYDKMMHDLHLAPLSELRDVENWLREVRDGAFDAAYRVKTRQAPEVWERYKLLGLKDLTEVVLLNEKLKLLKAAWRSPYYASVSKKAPKSSNGSDSAAQGQVVQNPPGHG